MLRSHFLSSFLPTSRNCLRIRFVLPSYTIEARFNLKAVKDNETRQKRKSSTKAVGVKLALSESRQGPATQCLEIEFCEGKKKRLTRSNVEGKEKEETQFNIR